MKTIRADALTTFDVSPDGSRVRFNVRDELGGTGSLDLPALCVNQLLMTLPRIIQQALRRSRGNDALRLAHPLEDFTLEPGETGRDGVRRHILTLRTGESFEVSFALTGSQLGALVQTVVDQVLISSEAVLEPVTLDS